MPYRSYRSPTKPLYIVWQAMLMLRVLQMYFLAQAVILSSISALISFFLSQKWEAMKAHAFCAVLEKI